jgi:hypothetical protein
MTTQIKPKEPGRPSRQPVLAEDATVIAKKLMADPGQWYLIGTGSIERLGVLSQTGYRIRRQAIKAFKQDGGTWDVRVSTDMAVPDREAAVELYCRWLPS